MMQEKQLQRKPRFFALHNFKASVLHESLRRNTARGLPLVRVKRDLEYLNIQRRDFTMKTRIFAIALTAALILLAAAFRTTAKQPVQEFELPDIYITSAH